MLHTSIPLARVVALDVSIAWHEGIAVAMHCADHIAARGTPAGLDTCTISISGEVAITGASATPLPDDPLFALVTALVDTPTAPPELVALLRRHETAQENGARASLAKELAFFSRPDVTAAVGAVAARALAKDAEAAAQREVEKLRAGAVVAAATENTATARPKALSVRHALIAAGGLGAVLAAGGAYRFVPLPAASLADAARVTAVKQTIDQLVDRGLQSLGVSADPAPSAAQTPPSAPVVAVGVARTQSKSPLVPKAWPLLAYAPVGHINQEPALASRETDALIAAETPPEEEAIEDRVLYRGTDATIDPPALTRAQLRAETDDGAPSITTYLEIIVNEEGTVDQVKLRSRRSSLHDRMLVSAAKAWHFTPALKDGRPVKYVLQMAIPQEPQR